MYMSTLGRIALRRWPLVILALLMTGSGLYAVSAMVQPEYKSSASVVLIPPKSLEEPDSNRYLSLGSLDQAVGVLVRSLVSDEVRSQVAADMPDGDYDVVADWTTSAPILVVTATAPTPAKTEALLTATLEQVPAVLERLQSSIGTQESQTITSLPLTRDEAPSRVLKPLLRALIAVAVLLLALSIGLIALIDGLVLRRARIHAVKGVPEAVAEQADQPQRVAEPAAPPAAETDLPNDADDDVPSAADVDAVTAANDEAQTAAATAAESAANDDAETEPEVQGARPSTAPPRRRTRSRNRSASPSVMPLHKPDLTTRREWTSDDAPQEGADHQTRAVR